MWLRLHIKSIVHSTLYTKSVHVQAQLVQNEIAQRIRNIIDRMGRAGVKFCSPP